MVLIRALLVARSRICWAITLAAAVFFVFCCRLVSASAFGELINVFEESPRLFAALLLASFRLWLVSVLPRA